MIAFFRKELLLLLIFIPLITLSQVLILKPHIEYGFSPDDVNTMSRFTALGSHPFSKFFKLWQEYGGPRFANPVYYGGIMFSFFKFNYAAYHVASLIFKIFSIISLYVLIQVLFKNHLLSFLSGLIFSFHYGSVGSMEMVARTQDYLVITGLNIFLIVFFLISANKLKNFFLLIFASLLLFSTFFINPIRGYPIVAFIFFIELFILFKNKTARSFYLETVKFSVLLLPFLLLSIWDLNSSSSVNNSLTGLKILIHKVSLGNLQLLLTPITTLGGLFLIGEPISPLYWSKWSLNNFLPYFFRGPFIFFGLITLLVSLIISKNKIKFFFFIMLINFLLEAVIFLIISNAKSLSAAVKMYYDPGTFAPLAVLGLYIIILTIFLFRKWLSEKNIFLSCYLFGILFATTFIFCTWIFQDIVYIPHGINGYSTLPSMGISIAISSLLLFTYHRLKNSKNFVKVFAPSVFLLVVPYFIFSNDQIQDYFQRNLKGGMKASVQEEVKNKFWQLIQNPEECDNLFYIEQDPTFRYGNILTLGQFSIWYSFYSPYHSTKPCPVALLAGSGDKLKEIYNAKEGGFDYQDIYGVNKFFPIDDFYALRLKGEDIIDIKEEVLNKINQ